jgi:two-component system cell cycle sensor histidine kinase/response regulator CckA
MTGSYDPLLVVLSILVAMLASYVALDLAGRVRTESRAARLGWLAGGATVMGLGIWSMHFIGMLAFRLPLPIAYDIPLMVLSVLVAITGSLIALMVISRPWATLVAGGVTLGGSIAGMHYIGMASMRVEAQRSYDAPLAAASILIAMVASLGALWLVFRLRSQATRKAPLIRILSAVVMGTAISGMHYTGMAAAHFTPGSEFANSGSYILASGQFGEAVVALAILVVGIALVGVVVDRSMQSRADIMTRLREKSAELAKSEQRTRLIIDTALDAVITMRSSGVISDWSAQAERMFGWSRSEAIGQRMSETIVPHRFRDAHNRGLKRFLATGEGPILNKRIEVIALSRDGREFPIELAISPAKLGEEWSFSAFIRDLTEQKKVEEAAKVGEQRYRALFEDIPVGLYRSTPAGNLIDVNAAMVSMLGYESREALLATSATAFYVDPTDRLRWTAQLASNGVVLDFEVRMRRADGAEIWVRDTTHVKRGPDGRVLLYEGVLEDITDRVETERAVQASERRLVQILEAAPLGIIVSDEVGVPVFANAGAKKMLGVGVVPGIGAAELAQAYQVYLAGTDEFYPVERMPIIRALTGEVVAVDDMEVRHEGQVISLHVQGAPVVDSEGRVVGAAVAFFDATEKRSMEAQLRQSSKMEAVGQLAGGVAHDFNNLLTVIMSYSAMLLDDLDPSNPLHADLQEIAAAADRAAGLTRQLLAFSRQQVMQPRVLDINAVFGDVEKMLRRIIGEDIELQIKLDADVARINADPGQLEQVLMNLVVNARDAMPAGGRLSIRTSNSELSKESAAGALDAPDGEYVMLSVSDTGTGMPREVQQRLFDPFFTTKDQGRGTGLGLSTVYGIVKQSGGEIYVYSEVGQGSTFKVYFPRFAEGGELEQVEITASEVPRGTETLLLVEDDDNLRNLVARVLSDRGYTVFVAAGGVEALAIAGNPGTLIDGVISDVVMSGMNGRQLVEMLLESRPGLGVLLMSGYTDDDVLRRGVLHGETAFLQKPFTPDQLARKVRGVLDRALISSVALKV